ncbi:hypothetical protein SIID45300_02184 [Candidatus Magnetaquicoccaceae bacterium FCR-1]|uniref:Uncharacterized protein n=1 Tax=Candidatus Magnetaquiglobus chichijimensis TaxID=3141448 RepID=A0ABQ0CAF9_9PROT
MQENEGNRVTDEFDTPWKDILVPYLRPGNPGNRGTREIREIGGHHTHFPYGYKFNRYSVPRF